MLKKEKKLIGKHGIGNYPRKAHRGEKAPTIKNESSISELWDKFRLSNVSVTGISKGE